jgi:hypothetical protein
MPMVFVSGLSSLGGTRKMRDPVATRSVAILVTTFRRNAKLLRLVKQLASFIADYRGPNRYFICVADSDRHNPVTLPPGVSCVINPGEGFDDNLLSAFRALSGAADFVFAMGDDDLPTPFVNPLTLIDAALNGADSDVILFNHVSYVEAEDIQLGDRYYRVAEVVNLCYEPLSIIGRRLPRYIAIAYRTSFLDTLRPQLAKFRGTLHAYAVPVLIAAVAKRFSFFDYPVCLFDRADKADGAWVDDLKITDGLRQFLTEIRAHVPEADYAQIEDGFRRNYFEKPVRPAELPAWAARPGTQAIAA